MNARKIANARWIARASVLLNTPKPNRNGSGDAYHSWNRDHASGTPNSSLPGTPPGCRAPVSTCATSSCAPVSFASGLSSAMVTSTRPSERASHPVAVPHLGRPAVPSGQNCCGRSGRSGWPGPVVCLPPYPVPLTALHQSGFLVVLQRPVMQRCGQPRLDHFLFRQVLERRVQLAKIVEIVEHRLDHLIDRLGRRPGG